MEHGAHFLILHYPLLKFKLFDSSAQYSDGPEVELNWPFPYPIQLLLQPLNLKGLFFYGIPRSQSYGVNTAAAAAAPRWEGLRSSRLRRLVGAHHLTT